MHRFRGLDPRARPTRWVLAAVALGITLGGTGPQAAQFASATLASDLDGIAWSASRLTAFLAYLAITGSVVYGLLLSTGVIDAVAHRPISFSLHKDLSVVGLTLAVLHVALLALDRTVPLTPVQLLVPFASPYRPLWVGVGQVGLALTAVVVASFWVRRLIGQRAWRLLHAVTFVAFIAVTAHAVFSGTDAGLTWWIAAGATAIVAFLFAYRLVLVATGPGRTAQPVRAGPAGRTGAVDATAAAPGVGGEAA